MADAIGVSLPNQTVIQKAQTFLSAFEKLKVDCGVGAIRLHDYDFHESDFDEIIDRSHIIADGSI